MTTYAFNRSHSAGYGLQAYQDQWIKKDAPLEFYNSLMETEQQKIPQIIRESRAYGVKILPPDINESGASFTLDGNAIRFGLIAVKGIADAGLQEIMKHRPFESYEEFEEKVPARKCNKTAKAALVACGAFDSLGGRDGWSAAEKRVGEKQVLGFMLDRSEFDRQKAFIEDRITPFHELAAYEQREEDVIVGGEIVSFSEAKTKRGNPYANVTLALDADEVKVKFWEEEYVKYRHLLAEGAAILVNGSYNEEWDNVSAKYCITPEQLKQAEAKGQ
jgi:DNA polymerase III alpha subunit